MNLVYFISYIQAVGQQTFKCPYCIKEFMTKRSRGGHLKAHRHQRALEQAAAAVLQPPRGSQVQTSAPTPMQPPQQHPNTTCRQLSVVVSQPNPRQKLLALPAPRQKQLALPAPSTDSAQAVTAPVQQLENAPDPTPFVFFRCCCGVTEKIPQTTRELKERGTYQGGCFTLYVYVLCATH